MSWYVNIEYSLQKTLGQKAKSASPERLAQCHPDPDSVPKRKHVQPWPVHNAWAPSKLEMLGFWQAFETCRRVVMAVQCKIWHPLDGCPCAKCALCNAYAFLYKTSVQISHSHDSHSTKVHPAWRPGATDRSLNMLNLHIFGTKSKLRDVLTWWPFPPWKQSGQSLGRAKSEARPF